MREMTGDAITLRDLRRAHSKLNDAIYWMEVASEDAQALRIARSIIENTVVEINEQCLLCKDSFPRTFPVIAAGDPIPGALICGDCNKRVTDATMVDDPDDESLRGLVGYERSLYRMRRSELVAEGHKYGVETEHRGQQTIIRKILEARNLLLTEEERLETE